MKKSELVKRKSGSGNNSRQRKKQKSCFDFMRTNTCKYGDGCKFAHVIQDKESVNLANREKIMNMNSKNSSYVARTFWQLYYPTDKDDSGNNSNDRYLFLHPNDIAMVGLAETHPIFKSDRIEVKFSNHNLNDSNNIAIPYNNQGNSLRVMIANDRPSAYRGAFILLFAEPTTINNRCMIGYYNKIADRTVTSKNTLIMGNYFE